MQNYQAQGQGNGYLRKPQAQTASGLIAREEKNGGALINGTYCWC
jgi:hypothetical protein